MVTVWSVAVVLQVVTNAPGSCAVLSKVTRSTLDAVLSLPTGSVTRSAGITAVTSPSASGARVNVKFWLAEEGARSEAVPPETDTSPSVKVSGSIGWPKSTVTVTDAALVTGGESVVKLGAGPARTMMVTILVWLAVLGSERRAGAVTASGCSPAGGGSSGIERESPVVDGEPGVVDRVGLRWGVKVSAERQDGKRAGRVGGQDSVV